jgi:hypothetical protein
VTTGGTFAFVSNASQGPYDPLAWPGVASPRRSGCNGLRIRDAA